MSGVAYVIKMHSWTTSILVGFWRFWCRSIATNESWRSAPELSKTEAYWSMSWACIGSYIVLMRIYFDSCVFTIYSPVHSFWGLSNSWFILAKLPGHPPTIEEHDRAVHQVRPRTQAEHQRIPGLLRLPSTGGYSIELWSLIERHCIIFI